VKALKLTADNIILSEKAPFIAMCGREMRCPPGKVLKMMFARPNGRG